MSSSDPNLIRLLGSVFGLVWIFGLMVAVTLPFMAVSVTLNIRRIRREFERLNNTLEGQAPARTQQTLGL